MEKQAGTPEPSQPTFKPGDKVYVEAVVTTVVTKASGTMLWLNYAHGTGRDIITLKGSTSPGIKAEHVVRKDATAKISDLTLTAGPNNECLMRHTPDEKSSDLTTVDKAVNRLWYLQAWAEHNDLAVVSNERLDILHEAATGNSKEESLDEGPKRKKGFLPLPLPEALKRAEETVKRDEDLANAVFKGFHQPPTPESEPCKDCTFDEAAKLRKLMLKAVEDYYGILTRISDER